MFEFVFEIYHNGELYESLSAEDQPLRRLCFMQNLFRAHFDAYLPCEPEEVTITSPYSASHLIQPSLLPVHEKALGKCHARYANAKERKQLHDTARTYVQNPVVDHGAKYQQNYPEGHRVAEA